MAAASQRSSATRHHLRFGAPQKLTSARIDLTSSQTDHAAWHADGRDLPHPCRRCVYRLTVPQARISLNRFRHRRFARAARPSATSPCSSEGQRRRGRLAVKFWRVGLVNSSRVPSTPDSCRHIICPRFCLDPGRFYCSNHCLSRRGIHNSEERTFFWRHSWFDLLEGRKR